MHSIIKVILHLFFWLIYCLLAANMSFKLKEGTDFILSHINIFILNFVWAAIAFYSIYLFGYKLFEKRRYIIYFVVVALLSFILTGVFYLLYRYTLDDGNLITPEIFFTSLPGTFIIANCGALLRGFIAWFDSNRAKSELEKRSLQHELESLKSQINPHFLFNTLNNIDSLIHINADKASASLLKLSDILRYMLYSTNEKMISLNKEAEHIENIIELQNLRSSETNTVHFDNSVANEKVLISPLIFTPFIENAFKHGIREEGARAITTSLEYNKPEVCFKCRNYFEPDNQNNNNQTGGIGLKNVRRRLELLYPERHLLQIKKENNIFEITLRITTQ